MMGPMHEEIGLMMGPMHEEIGLFACTKIKTHSVHVIAPLFLHIG